MQSPGGDDDDAAVSPAEEAELRALAEEIGLPPPRRRDPRLAPDVNENLLRALARREFTGQAARTLHTMIDSYESWSDAYRRILFEEVSRRDVTPPE